MIRIGVTGGIGSGKSTVVRRWEQHGAAICHADDLAKQLMTEDPEVRAQIGEAFGDNAWNDDGSLNRSWLAEEAFERGRVGELNAIVHPRIPSAVETAVRRAEEEKRPAFVYEAALLPGNRKPSFLDYLVIVTAPRDVRIRRVAERDGTGTDSVEARMNQQPEFSKLLHLADLVIENEGSREELQKKADDVYKKLVTS